MGTDQGQKRFEKAINSNVTDQTDTNILKAFLQSRENTPAEAEKSRNALPT